MSKLEDYYKWETLSIPAIISVIVKFHECTEMNFETYIANVESGIWYKIAFVHKEKSYLVSASRLDLLHKRFIELLDRLEMRKPFLEKK